MDLITREQNESPRDFIKRLSEENRAFYQSPRGEGALRDFGQKFPRPWIYVAELIQNAIDENATIISFRIQDEKTLIFEHNGEPFDFGRDVIGLCTKGVSTKGAGTVGFMGVGFKSVFGCYQRVNISSNEWSFYTQVNFRTGDRYGDKQREWLGAMCPVWDDTIKKPSDGMTCRFELRDRCIENKSIDSDLNEILKKDLALLPLLSKQGVHTLVWNKIVWTLSIAEKVPFEDRSGARIRVEARSEAKKALYSWLIFSQEYSPSHDAVRRFLEHRQLNPSNDEEKEKTYQDASRNRSVEAFFKLDEDGFPEFPKVGEAFALLPTNVKLPIGVHIQADWLLTQSRQELMDADLKSNVWHREIIMNIPQITKQYYRWIVGNSGPARGFWSQIHNVLPSLDEKSLDSFSWFFGGDEEDPIDTSPLLVSLCEALKTEKMLPTHRPNGVGFERPAVARLLPQSLNEKCGNEEMVPWKLFGTEIVNTEHIEEKSINSLTKLGLLPKLTASELEASWRDDRVKTWFESFPKHERYAKLSEVLAGLAPLDSDPTWKSAKIDCIPAENGSFSSRENTRRYPLGWDLFSNNDFFQGIMKNLLTSSVPMVRWEFDWFTQSRARKATEYLESISRSDLEELVNAWWDSHVDHDLDSEKIEEILKFTHQVCTKHEKQKTWTKKVLCIGKSGQLQLLSLQDTLLADPYTESHRRAFFPDLPVISPKYYEYDSTAEWKKFFESCEPSPNGRFRLQYRSQKVAPSLMFEENLPDLRSTDLCLPAFRTATVTNNKFTIIDIEFNVEQTKLLTENNNESQLKKLLSWLVEDIEHLEQYSSVLIFYIPRNKNVSERLPNHRVTGWIKLLRDNPWLYSSDNRGPFKPEDILTAYDAARPDAPVVSSMPERLIRIFEKHKVIFGSAIPKPGPFRELQIHGHTWPIEKVSETIAEILQLSSTTEEDKHALINLLLSEPMILLPKEIRMADRSTRVSLRRIVKRAGQKNRSDLGWVVAEQELRTHTGYDQFFTIVESIISTPEQLTGDQAIDFLQWIWETEPESEIVRKALPLAYAYIIEDSDKNLSVDGRWILAEETVKVYTLGGRWVKTSEEPGVFFDDIGFLNYNVIPKSRRVTPTHLGSNDKPENQKAAAALLNVLLVSDHYEIVPIEGENLSISADWNRNFATLYAVLAELLSQNRSTGDEDDEEELPTDSAPPNKRQPLTLRVVSMLEKVAREKETGKIIDRKTLNALIDEGVAIVSGAPRDFAAELCMLIFQYFNAARRQNILPITNFVVVLLMEIGDKNFLEQLNIFAKKHGLKEVKKFVNPANEVETGEDGISKENEPTKPADESKARAEDEELDNELDDESIDNPDEELDDDIDDLDIDIDEDEVIAIHNKIFGSNKQGNGSQAPSNEPRMNRNSSGGSPAGPSARRSSPNNDEVTPPVAPGHGKASSSNHTHSPSNHRLRSYVHNVNHANDEENTNEDSNENDAVVVGRAGEVAAMEFERQRGWTPTKMHHNNPGYDIESIGPNGEKIFIEVKAVSSDWSESGVAVSATQFEFAQRNPESTWLYVVENVGVVGEETVYRIPSPATQVTEFRFDSGWKSVAQTAPDSTSTEQAPVVGNRVRCLNDEQREGTIIEVTPWGKLLKIVIKFDDDTEMPTIYNPDRYELI